MGELRNNLLRIFLTNAYVVSDLFPFKKVDVGGQPKLAVEDAVEHGQWDEEYFGRLLSFAKDADKVGVALHLTVFNFFDFGDPAWRAPGKIPGLSPWKAGNTRDLTPDWGKTHLIADDLGTPADRCLKFMDVKKDSLTKVKREFINKLVNTLRGQGNIIFELMNEPRGPAGTTAEYQARFLSQVADIILTASGAWRPLICVNAHPPVPTDTTTFSTPLDIMTWKDLKSRIARYDDIDIVSYHGLSGLAVKEIICSKLQPPKRHEASFAQVDNDSIVARTRDFLPNYKDKAIMYSTDGANVHPHEFNGAFMLARDGQIETGLNDDTTGVDAYTQRHQSDLKNWAYWCLAQALANPGRCHFQNHSSFVYAFIRVRESLAKLTGAGAGAGDTDFAPPFAPGVWTNWQWRNLPPNDFTSAVNLKASAGDIVVQLGTVEKPADAAQAGTVEAGFLHVFTAKSRTVRAVVAYTPLSVSSRSTGATVVPAVVLRLHVLDAAGNTGALLMRQHVVLQRGAAPGKIEVAASVTPGQRCALILAAGVEVQYQNRWQGYGEVIARYTRATLFL